MNCMKVFRVVFHYKREVAAYIEAEDEADIDGYLTENPTFDILEDHPELIESDESSFDPENEYGDYEVQDAGNVTTSWVITPGFELQEKE